MLILSRHFMGWYSPRLPGAFGRQRRGEPSPYPSGYCDCRRATREDTKERVSSNFVTECHKMRYISL